MDEKIKTLKKWIEESENIVFFGGAGVSTESGIPDFRGENGLYKQEREIPLEVILSHGFFMEHPEVFYRYLKTEDRMNEKKPNPAHLRLAEFEREGKLKAVITQNADGLHQMAGSEKVYELHGNGNRFFCVDCGKEYTRQFVEECEEVPRCECGGLIRPGAVLFGEPLDQKVLAGAINAVENADMLIVGGTSLVVYPAAGLVDFYNGNKLVLINDQATPLDGQADLVITDKIGEVFSQI